MHTHIKSISITVPCTITYAQAPARTQAQPTARDASPQPADTLAAPRTRVRPMMIGNDVAFFPVRSEQEPSAFDRLCAWLFG